MVKPKRQPDKRNNLSPRQQKELNELITLGTEGIRDASGKWRSGLDGKQTARFRFLWRRAGGGNG
jgi:hypothetical protein